MDAAAVFRHEPADATEHIPGPANAVLFALDAIRPTPGCWPKTCDESRRRSVSDNPTEYDAGPPAPRCGISDNALGILAGRA
jgi:hypothetical protein